MTCGASFKTEFIRCPNDGTALTITTTDPLLGSDAIEPYVIDAFLGEGTTGRVYRAHHKHLPDRRYAIKVLHADMASVPMMRLRFAKEAEAASGLDHPNVVTVHDVGRSRHGLMYIAMELVEGTSLASIVDRGPMSATRAVALARGICAGLAHAHEHGLIHRDLKPENILIVDGPDGEIARIADFGIAISADPSEARLTATGYSVGTPAYVAPEQSIAGRGFDHRVDLYSLGVTLYEMLTGCLPFDGGAMEQILVKVSHRAPPMSERAPEVYVPPWLQRVVSRLVERNPEARYPTAREVLAALTPTSTAEDRLATMDLPVSRWRGRRWPVAALAIAGAVAIAGVVWASSSRSTAPAHVPPAPAITVAPIAAEPVTPPPVAVAPTPVATPPPVADEPAAAPRSRARRRPRAAEESAPPSPAPGPAAAVPTVEIPPEAPAPPPPSPAPAPPRPVAPPPPVPLEARLAHVDVDGALAASVVRRAITRAMPALQSCAASATASAVQIRFVIGEARRPAQLRATGASATTRGCVSEAMAGLRVETAPDVGDAVVTIRIDFAPRGKA